VAPPGAPPEGDATGDWDQTPHRVPTQCFRFCKGDTIGEDEAAGEGGKWFQPPLPVVAPLHTGGFQRSASLDQTHPPPLKCFA